MEAFDGCDISVHIYLQKIWALSKICGSVWRLYFHV